MAFGPITGGALLEHFWYGSIFLVNVPIVVVTLLGSRLLIPKLKAEARHRFDIRGVLISTAGVTLLVLAIIEGPQWGWTAAGTLACFAVAVGLLALFTVVELRTEKPLLDVRVFTIPRFSGGALSIAVAFFCLFGFIFLVTQYFQFVKGYSTLSAGVHTLPFAIVAAIFTPLAAVVALRVGTRLVVGTGLLLMGGGLVMSGLTSKPDTAFFGPIIVAMILLALGLSSITAPATEAVMGSLAADQFGAGAAVNNTTRELGGTLGVAVLGSVFASAYAPRIIGPSAHTRFRPPPRRRRTRRWRPPWPLSTTRRPPPNRSSRLRRGVRSRIQSGVPGRCRRRRARRRQRLPAASRADAPDSGQSGRVRARAGVESPAPSSPDDADSAAPRPPRRPIASGQKVSVAPILNAGCGSIFGAVGEAAEGKRWGAPGAGSGCQRFGRPGGHVLSVRLVVRSV